ncbi:FAD/NAD(P)-binding domain-containing protein [Plenodomus tracheiphilus IPT5]|uniref:FAD/NAD(P)-binding domain-containing protein n=1 Tax=Plenodomus tracheiphilus IPT5 TaxID=1408161 RepID=A0A6A7B3L9_9PLEO|nr:FAD/NAD(P)-binding domain-containing protein [Plenodomus tracheiphilus IPT5]
MHVLIVGAGIGGLVLAQSLVKQNVSFEIFERDEDKDARFQGWAIVIHSIIDQLLSVLPSDMPDLKQSTDHLDPLDLPCQLVYYYGYQEGKFGFQDSPQFQMIRAERSKLRDWLLTKIPVQWGKHVTRIEQGDEGAEVFFADGSSAKGDIVIGADGANSLVREQLLQKSNADLLNVVPLSAIVGEVTLSGDEFKRQLALGHSAYNLINPELGFIGFIGLHHALPDGASGKFYWMLMQPDSDIAKPDHWLHNSTEQQKLDHVLKTVSPLAPELQEIFRLTPVDGVRKDLHIWKDLELDSIPAGRVVLLGDAAHAMTPAGGVGAFHALIDAIQLGQVLTKLDKEGVAGDIGVVKQAVGAFHGQMLKRGSEAVRTSRASYEEAKRKAVTKEHFIPGLRPLPLVRPEDITLKVKA